MERGRKHINERWPEYGALLTDDALLERAGRSWPHVAGFPLPSRLFAGLDPHLDDRLKRIERDKDVQLCREVARLPPHEQRAFLELYLVDPLDALHWASLPAWKRPIRKGDKDDIQIWKFFTIERLNMELVAREAPPSWSMASQGAQLKQIYGVLSYLTPVGLQRLCLVMSTFGAMLQNKQDVGEVVKKPWETRA
ncbi:MAG: hypothetical protein H0W08_21575 [Acidobacteria bacterium]|nr:hypothetical protein [Acidobacteriota bacterium]